MGRIITASSARAISLDVARFNALQPAACSILTQMTFGRYLVRKH
jgi:hypothetical protein